MTYNPTSPVYDPSNNPALKQKKEGLKKKIWKKCEYLFLEYSEEEEEEEEVEEEEENK